MNYEEKYKNALERARKLYEKGTITESIGYIFPELAESKDEKIKEALIQLVKCNERSGYLVLNNVSTGSMISWLEKQGKKEVKNEITNRFSTEQKINEYIVPRKC